MRSGTVCIIGRTNVGKSTFLNAALGEPLAITSSKPQTTRDTLLGIVNLDNAQVAFVDTPGLHRPRTELGRRMNAAAVDSARTTDVVLFVVEARGVEKRRRLKSLPAGSKDRVDSLLAPDDQKLLQLIPAGTPALVVINKVDLVHDKTALLPLIEELASHPVVRSVLPVSVRQQCDVTHILNEVAALLPEGEPQYSPDEITDRPSSFFAREYVREQVMRLAEREVPHAVAVTIDEFSTHRGTTRICATIHVEKAGQRAIIVGAKGARIKEIGIAARERIEALLDCHVRLELFVRVSDRWKDTPRRLAELGYEADRGLELSSLLPKRDASARAPRSRARAKAATNEQTRPKTGTPAKPTSNKQAQPTTGTPSKTTSNKRARPTTGTPSNASRKPTSARKKTRRAPSRGKRKVSAR